jgi:hypothetical protein
MMHPFRWFLGLLLAVLFVLVLAGGAHMQPSDASIGDAASLHLAAQIAPRADRYVLLAWNDLGMHCYNRDFQDLGVLPPFNTLWAQVVKVGDPPEVVTSNIRVEYSFPDNAYSVNGPNGANKTNFWQYAAALFPTRPPNFGPNIGLAGKGLSGTMDLNTDHFEAVGIPLTEYSDSEVAKAPANPMAWQRQPYQLAHIVAKDATTGVVLAENTVVAPVSTEMHCDTCHSDGQRDSISTGKVETNILTLHDREEGTQLMNSRPVLCASCHSSNALGTPGKPGIRPLSNSMHQKHMDQEVQLPPGTDACYACHPGPQTRCLRDAMSLRHGFTCQSCHGQLSQVAFNPNPWLNEPRCDNVACHGSTVAQDQALYRMSKGHGAVRCEACHDSTHAIATSREANDAIKFVNLQRYAGTLNKCSVCHLARIAGTIHPPTAVNVQPRSYLPAIGQ